MTASSTPANANKPKLRLRIPLTIVAALIGCIGMIIAADPVAEWWLEFFTSTSTPTIMITSTVAEIATETMPVTETPTEIVEWLPGEDWVHGCISQQWSVYPFRETSIDEYGCYQQPIWDFISTKNGGLYILARHKDLISAEEYGLFVQLPQSAVVQLEMDLDEIDNGEVWVGIFSERDVVSDGLLIVVPPGPVLNEHAFAVRAMPEQEQVDLTPIYKSNQGVYTVGFDLTKGSVSAIVENTQRETFPFSSPQRWLFIGYRAKLMPKQGWANIEVLIKDLVISPN